MIGKASEITRDTTMSELVKMCTEARDNGKEFTPLQVHEMILQARTIGFMEGLNRG